MKWTNKKFWSAIATLVVIVGLILGYEMDAYTWEQILEAIRTIVETILE